MEKATWNHREPVRSDGGDARSGGGAHPPHRRAKARPWGDIPSSAIVPSAVSTLTEDLLKYYQHVTRAVLGDDPQLMKVGWGRGSPPTSS